jgi:DNA-binding MarR family transcriptional regulator
MESPELSAFLNTLRSATKVIGSTDQLLRDTASGMTTREWDVLAFAGAYGPVRPSELLRLAVLTHSAQTLSSTIDRLEERGFVSRRDHPSDRRAVLVELTDEGRQVVADLFPVVARNVIQPFSTRYTDEELATLAGLLDRP